MQITIALNDDILLKELSLKLGKSLEMVLPYKNTPILAKILKVNFGEHTYTIETKDEKILVALLDPKNNLSVGWKKAT